MDLSNVAQAFKNLLLFCLPSVIYVLILRWRSGLGLAELARRLGLVIGTKRSPYVIAVVAAVPGAFLGVFLSSWTGGFEGSVLAPFVGATPTAAMVLGALAYGLIGTGFPEELLFRGLIGGALFRRMSFLKANFLQACIFLAPHLLILLLAPDLWFLAIPIPLALGLLNGWLRERSGSIWPGVIIHATSNVAGALAVLNWGSM